ncbi:MAG: hypothetical protein Q4C70_12475 [Planctomycetia bacterium]|nr:hypothetical protein [Planctomycetia bacterium]
MNLSALLLSFAFLQVALVPSSSTQFFVTPNTEAVLTFQVSESTENQADTEKNTQKITQTDAPEFKLLDVNGTEIRTISAKLTENGTCTLTIFLPQGYYELQTADGTQSFGLVSLPPFTDADAKHYQTVADPFFAIDGAMSWLVAKQDMDQKRDELAQIARRSGIAMIRERLSWNECQSATGTENIQPEPRRHYDSCRKMIQRQGVEVLELCHDAPKWMEKTGNRYPKDFLTVHDSWNVFTQHWNRTWGGMEVWNEPEISFGAELPADQYVPLLKTIAWQQQNSPAEKEKLAETGKRTPLVGGVMATYAREWLDHAVKCGVLDVCDVFSFHTYARAPEVEKLYSNFQSWLRDSGQPTKPLWLTECGRPWTIGPGRPPQIEDLTSAIDIVMKGVEARAFGIQRYFPFVYPYYEERTNNFGMMSRDYTPLRSFAGYSQMIRTLAHREYLGDLANIPDGWTHARVFSSVKTPTSATDSASAAGSASVTDSATITVSTPRKDAVLVALYAPTIESRKLTLPCRILHAERVTGETIPLHADGCTLESADGFVYLWLAESDISPILNADTPMKKLHDERRADEKNSRNAKNAESAKKAENTQKTDMKPNLSPIILRYDVDEKTTAWTRNGYRFKQNCDEEITLKFRVTNLSATAKTIPVTCRAQYEDTRILDAPKSITVPGNGVADFQIRVITGAEYRKIGLFCPIEVTAEDRVLLNIQTSFTLENLLKITSQQKRLDIRDLSRWHKSAAGCCDNLKFSETSPNWILMAHFTEGDHWVYPDFQLPEDVNIGDYDGIIVRARCWDSTNKTQVRIFTYQPNSAFFTSDTIIPTDGEWHNVQIPFRSLVFCPATGGKLADFQPDKVRKISIGANTKGEAVQVEVSDFYLYHN